MLCASALIYFSLKIRKDKMIPIVARIIIFTNLILMKVNGQLCTLFVNNAQKDLTCACGLKYRFLSGLNIYAKCNHNVDVCLDAANTYCGRMNFAINVYRRQISSKSVIIFDAKPIAGVGLGGSTIDPDPLIVNITHTSPVLLSNPIVFKSCTAAIGETKCVKCEICESKSAVIADCSNVGFDMLYYAPVFNRCLGFTES